MSFCTIFNLYNIWTEFLTRYNPLLDLVGEELLDQKAGHRETPARDVTMMTSLAWLFSPVREVLPEVPALKYLFKKIWFMKYSLFCCFRLKNGHQSVDKFPAGHWKLWKRCKKEWQIFISNLFKLKLSAVCSKL